MSYREVFPKDGGDGEWIDTPDLLMTTEQAWEKLGRDLGKWTPEQKSEMAAQLREYSGRVSKKQLLAMPCSRWIN